MQEPRKCVLVPKLDIKPGALTRNWDICDLIPLKGLQAIVINNLGYCFKVGTFFFVFLKWPSGQGRLKRPTQPTLCDSQSGSVYCVVWCIKERWSVINPMKFNLNRWFHLRYNNNPLLPDNKLIIIQYYKLLLWLSCPKSILITNW